MTNYELVCVLPGTLTEGEVKPILEKVKEAVSGEGGENIEVTTQEKTKLNYPVKHIRYGYYEIFTFEAEPEKIKALQKRINLIPEILRALINKYSPEVRKRDLEIKAKMQTRRLANEATKASKEEKEVQGEEVEKEIKQEKIKITDLPKADQPKAGKVDLGDIDKKLDELLGGDLENV